MRDADGELRGALDGRSAAPRAVSPIDVVLFCVASAGCGLLVASVSTWWDWAMWVLIPQALGMVCGAPAGLLLAAGYAVRRTGAVWLCLWGPGFTIAVAIAFSGPAWAIGERGALCATGLVVGCLAAALAAAGAFRPGPAGPTCPTCGYDLRGLGPRGCPECGGGAKERRP